MSHAPLVGQENARARQAVQPEREVHFLRPFAGMVGDIGQQSIKINPLQLQPQRAGFHQRQIKNVVDQVF